MYLLYITVGMVQIDPSDDHPEGPGYLRPSLRGHWVGRFVSGYIFPIIAWYLKRCLEGFRYRLGYMPNHECHLATGWRRTVLAARLLCPW
jgi:hypothetical protein